MEERIIYEGHRRAPGGEQDVTVRHEPDGIVIPLLAMASQRLANHAPSGFQWGYLGSGPAQLSLALLLDATGDEALSLRHYHDFKFMVVGNLDDDWSINRNDIIEWIDTRESKILADNICQN